MTVRAGNFRRLFEGEDAMKREAASLGVAIRAAIGDSLAPVTPAAAKRLQVIVNRAVDRTYGANEDAALNSPVGKALSKVMAAQDGDVVKEAISGATAMIGTARMKRLRAHAER